MAVRVALRSLCPVAPVPRSRQVRLADRIRPRSTGLPGTPTPPPLDPAWTPLFSPAGAVITEIGGVLSPGAVIAREIGLPAIVGVEDATRRISTGRRVKVNALNGTVELL